MEDDTKQFLTLDASVVLASLLPNEKYAQLSRVLLEQAAIKPVQIIVPSLLDLEVTNAIRSAVLSKRINAKSGTETLKVYWDIPLKRMELNRVDVERSLTISIRYSCSVYDAIYVALAQRQNCRFYTLDTMLYHKLKSFFPFIVLLSEEKPAYK